MNTSQERAPSIGCSMTATAYMLAAYLKIAHGPPDDHK